MVKRLILAVTSIWLFFAGAQSVLSQEALEPQSSDIASRLTLDISAALLSRSRSADLPLIADGANTVLNANQFSFDPVMGLDASIGFRLDSNWSVEARGLLPQDFESAMTIAPPGNRILTRPKTLFIGTSLDATYKSSLRSGEVNIGYALNENFRVLAGARTISLVDDINMLFDSNVFNVQSRADNSLLGAQIGLAGTWSTGGLTFDAKVKAGPLNNSVSNLVEAEQPVGKFYSNYSGNFQNMAHMVEGEISGSYDLGDNLAISIGYNFLYLGNVALAPNQLPISGRLNVVGRNAMPDAGFGNVFYHGVKAGLLGTF